MAWLDRFGIRTFTKPEPEPEPEAKETYHTDGFDRRYANLDSGYVPDGEIKGAVLGVNDAIASLLRLTEPGTVVSAASAMHAYDASSAVSVPVNWIAEAFGRCSASAEESPDGRCGAQLGNARSAAEPSPAMVARPLSRNLGASTI